MRADLVSRAVRPRGLSALDQLRPRRRSACWYRTCLSLGSYIAFFSPGPAADERSLRLCGRVRFGHLVAGLAAPERRQRMGRPALRRPRSRRRRWPRLVTTWRSERLRL